MEVTFVERGEGWRTRGRPPRDIPETLIEMIRQTYEQNVQAQIPIAGTTAAEVREVLSLLRLGAERLGWRLRAQQDDSYIRFYAEDRP